MRPTTLHVFSCISPTGLRLEVTGRDAEDCAEIAAKAFGVHPNFVRRAYVRSITARVATVFEREMEPLRMALMEAEGRQ